jgi:rhodanese-related sulfurtransferase
MDYPAPFFEALENYKETKATEEASEENASAGDAVEYVEVDGYKQITPETAQKMMETETGYVIVDVRHDDEYYDGHIPGAVLITNEYIEDKPLSELPDKDQLILVYCRSGRRSKDAARKLAAIGYTNVYEFGGIIDWPGPITTE